jgi:hypothetical protein
MDRSHSECATESPHSNETVQADLHRELAVSLAFADLSQDAAGLQACYLEVSGAAGAWR